MAFHSMQTEEQSQVQHLAALLGIDTDFPFVYSLGYKEQFLMNNPDNLDVTYHYYDCNCAKCYAAHYPCDDSECDYCYAVRTIKADAQDRYHRTGVYSYYMADNVMPSTSVKSVGNIIDYAEYKALGDVTIDANDILWRECSGCNILIAKYTADLNDDYCSESCKKEHETFFCYDCEVVIVDKYGELCRSCKQDREDEANDEDYCDDSGTLNGNYYELGDIVDINDYGRLEHCWIDPQGHARYVGYCRHHDTAVKMGWGGVDKAERNGYIHVSSYWSNANRFVHIPNRPTKEQIMTMYDYCQANECVTIPECVAEYAQKRVSADDKPEYVSMTYSVITSTTRYLREMLYPLNGD